jgi:hypothetical protein
MVEEKGAELIETIAIAFYEFALDPEDWMQEDEYLDCATSAAMWCLVSFLNMTLYELQQPAHHEPDPESISEVNREILELSRLRMSQVLMDAVSKDN